VHNNYKGINLIFKLLLIL